MAAWHESFRVDGKWKYISENGISSLPGKRLCPKVARTLPKTGLKTINERCCHGKQPPNTKTGVSRKQKSSAITGLDIHDMNDFEVFELPHFPMTL